MSIWKLVRLDFGRNPVHFGEVGIGLEETSERIRSDTLFSAWVSSYARLLGKKAVTDLLDSFRQSPDNPSERPEAPPFRVSSTFIYQKQDEADYIYYLPKLIQQPREYPANDLKFAKTYRKLSYLPLSVWRRWYQGEGFDPVENAKEIESHSKNPEEAVGILSSAGTFKYNQAFKKQTVPKVSIDRTTRATNFYHTGFVQFAPSAGLYFLIEFPNENVQLEQELKAALELLGEEGLGGERSSGAGRFQISYWDDLPDIWQSVIDADGTQYGLISLFWENPVPPALLDPSLDKPAQYALQARGGWIASPFSGRQLRRKMIQMFTEGSVFPQAPQGVLADVTPNEFKISDTEYRPHPIYRSGISFSLPVVL